MALEQTKIIKIHIDKRILPKTDLAKEMECSTAKINEYILGDAPLPEGINTITPKKDGLVEVITEVKKEVPKYEGVFFNPLKNGDKTFYIVYKDLKTNKNIQLKIGKESQGITEQYCLNERTALLLYARI